MGSTRAIPLLTTAARGRNTPAPLTAHVSAETRCRHYAVDSFRGLPTPWCRVPNEPDAAGVVSAVVGTGFDDDSAGAVGAASRRRRDPRRAAVPRAMAGLEPRVRAGWNRARLSVRPDGAARPGARAASGAAAAFRTPLRCRFSFPMSCGDASTCCDAACLTRCHLRFVSLSCHFFVPTSDADV